MTPNVIGWLREAIGQERRALKQQRNMWGNRWPPLDDCERDAVHQAALHAPHVTTSALAAVEQEMAEMRKRPTLEEVEDAIAPLMYDRVEHQRVMSELRALYAEKARAEGGT